MDIKYGQILVSFKHAMKESYYMVLRFRHIVEEICHPTFCPYRKIFGYDFLTKL